MPQLRITPSFVVAVLALVVASGGAGFAAGQITSAQIKDGAVQGRDLRDGTVQSRDVRDGTIQSRDVRNGSIAGDDVRDRSVSRRKLDRACPPLHAEVFGGCVSLKPYGRSSYLAAVDDCNRRNGRLPTMGELQWIATHDEYTWADGNNANYEFSSDHTDSNPIVPLGMRRDGTPVVNVSAQYFWHHCVITY